MIGYDTTIKEALLLGGIVSLIITAPLWMPIIYEIWKIKRNERKTL